MAAPSGALTALPDILAVKSPRAVGGTTSVPGVAPPALDAAARNMTSLHDFRHTVAQAANAAPTFSAGGVMHAPGKASGLRITTERAGAPPGTRDGAAAEVWGGGGGGGGGGGSGGGGAGSPAPLARTRTGLLAARRAAARAPASYDLDGDLAVGQREFYWATQFDANGDGTLSPGERAEAARLMRAAASRVVFLSTAPGGRIRGNFSRHPPAHSVQTGHHTVQIEGAVVSEQLEGVTALAHARLDGGEFGAAATLGRAGAHLPPALADAVGTVLLGSTVGATRGAGAEVAADAAATVAAYHAAGAPPPDFDGVTVKPAFRAELHASGATLASDLRARRKAAAAPDLTYDVDGDGGVSNRDYFFATRQDRAGTHTLSRAARAAAAAEAAGGGAGGSFVHLSTGGGAGADGHRVMQHDGVVVGEEVAGGWGALARARAEGADAGAGADGGPRAAGDAPPGGAGAAAEALGADGLSTNGRVALETVRGAVTDYDTVTVKPMYRPALAASGARTVRELALHRRRDRRPDASFDLSGAGGVVSEADYQLSKRFDAGDKGFLTADERAAALAAVAGGLRDQFARLSTGAGAHTATRTFQIGGKVVSGEGVLLGGGADDDDDETNDVPYDATVRLPTKGAVPGLDMSPAQRRGGRAAAPGAAAADSGGGAPRVALSTGIIPGVARAIVHFSDGRQEAFGGFARGLGAGGATNMMAPKPAQSPEADGAGAPARAPLAATSEWASTAAIDFYADPAAQTSQLTARPPRGLYAEAPFRVHNQTTFCDPDAPRDVARQAPFALMGVGGAGDGLAGDAAAQAQRGTAAELALLTRSQLVAARRVRAAGDGDAAAAARGGAAAGVATTAAAGALFANSLTGAMAGAWTELHGPVHAAAALAARAGSLSPRAPPFGATRQDAAAAAVRLPSGEAATLDRTGRGEFAGGLSGLDTTAALAAMPPQFNT